MRGYWEGRPLFDGFTGAFAKYRDRVALVDGISGPVTYRQLDERSAHLARILLDLGLGPLDRMIVQLPNTALFGYLYFALQRIGAAPVLALPGHRRREISQFAEISGARALAIPAAARGFDFTAMAAGVMAAYPELELCLVQGADGPQSTALPDERFVRLEELMDREPRATAADVSRVRIDPSDPALFLLSGGTTGIPKLIPRTHNDYLYNSKIAAAVCGWAPKYFPPSLRTDIGGRLREKMMFGSDHPSLPYERILREWDELGYDQSVLDLVFHANAERVLGL